MVTLNTETIIDTILRREGRLCCTDQPSDCSGPTKRRYHRRCPARPSH